jgi:hypothetical protein
VEDVGDEATAHATRPTRAWSLLRRSSLSYIRHRLNVNRLRELENSVDGLDGHFIRAVVEQR